MMSELLLTNANVITLDDDVPEASAVAVRDGRITWAGPASEASQHVGSGHRTVDLGGATVVPGFIDSHHHLMTLGYWMANIDCSFPKVKSIGDIVEQVRLRGADIPAGQWIQGRGYDDNKLAERRHLTRSDLDAVSPQHPVIIRNASGHMCVANSFALRQAGIVRGTPDPFGGHVDVDADGEPTGLLQESAQELLGVDWLPRKPEELAPLLHTAGQAYLAAGVTSGHEAGIWTPQEFSVLQNAAQNGTLALRTYMMIRTPMLDALEGVGVHTGFGDDMLRIGSIKIISDGSLIGRTAAVEEPFVGHTHDDLGLASYTQDELDELVWRGHSAGWQMAIHAIGDRAITMCLDSYEKALTKQPRADHRHRIEHCGIVSPEIIQRMARMRVIPSGQPPFIAEFGDGFLEHLSPERARYTYPLRSFLDAGIPLAGGSDSPVSSYQPLIGIQAAVTEKTSSGMDFAPEEKLTVDEALRIYTRNGAYAAFDEKIKGSITPGKYGDFAVLGADPRSVPADEIAQIPVLATVRGGEFVYEAPMG
jgi:predicted amidohydrolase YtcJ